MRKKETVLTQQQFEPRSGFRRRLLQAAGVLAAGPVVAGMDNATATDRSAASHSGQLIRKPIPASNEPLAVIGLGTARTFRNPTDHEFQQQLLQVLHLFFSHGGQLVDSSPMYGPAEEIFGELLTAYKAAGASTADGKRKDKSKASGASNLFAATKVWTEGEQQGIEQMQASMKKMHVPRMDLMQIHNLKDWKVHLRTLRRWKEEGRIRYIGITTSHGRSHAELLDIMRTEPLDFVQFSYNLLDREAESRLLPLAADKGIAPLINRPYQEGRLFAATKNKPLPAVAQELGCTSWGQLYLKWVLGHPAATCVIPASSKPRHVLDNMGAGYGALPDASQRTAILQACTTPG